MGGSMGWPDAHGASGLCGMAPRHAVELGMQPLLPALIVLTAVAVLRRCLRRRPPSASLVPPTAPPLPPQALVVLDWLRVLAAWAVVVWHVRWMLLVEYRPALSPARALKAFYFVTSLGHQAVIVFFILSGFFIGWAVVTASDGGRWSWATYALRRATRLYAVLVPGLVLTLLWDAAGMALCGSTHGIYAGEMAGRRLGLTEPRVTLSVGHFLGNLGFLQDIFIAPFGSNDPLWSLSYEGWAYVLLPLLVRAACWDATPAKRAGCATLALALLIAGGPSLHFYFAIWLCGAGLALGWYCRPTRLRHAWPVWAGGIVFLGVLVIAWELRDEKAYTDPALGVATALFLWTLLAWAHGNPAGPPRTPTWVGTVGSRLAGFSYTLYVCHYPPLMFLHAAYLNGSRLAPTAGPIAAVLLLTVLVTAGYAYPLSRLTEAHTDRLRRWMQRGLTGRENVRSAVSVPAVQSPLVAAAAAPRGVSLRHSGVQESPHAD